MSLSLPLNSAHNKLNHRSRKSLGFKTPLEVFMKAFSKAMAA
jgi:IS30 family transposase